MIVGRNQPKLYTRSAGGLLFIVAKLKAEDNFLMPAMLQSL
jgi:hypothetical protein